MDLQKVLVRHGIPLDRWGKGSAKTLDHLKREIEMRESILVKEYGGLVRVTTVLYIVVECVSPEGRCFRLREDRQEFADGRVRCRTLDGSLAEKLKAGEEPDKSAVVRALSEELGISRVLHARALGVEVSEEESPSYPGLRARFTNHKWVAEIYATDFNPDGYVEIQNDKKTYFGWDMAPQ